MPFYVLLRSPKINIVTVQDLHDNILSVIVDTKELRNEDIGKIVFKNEEKLYGFNVSSSIMTFWTLNEANLQWKVRILDKDEIVEFRNA